MSTRKHEFEIEIPAPVDDVWRILAEGPGVEKWFAPSVEVKPGVGGSFKLSWGPECEGTAPIHLWEEGKRLGWTEGAKTVEIEIEPASGGASTRLRLVHSGFGAGAEFDQEYDSTHGGWHTFLASLSHVASHYAHVPAVHIYSLKIVPQPVAERWAWLTGPDGVAIDSVVEGQPYRARIGGIPVAGVVVRHPKPGYLCLAGPHAVICLFVEKSGQDSMQTIQWILFGDARAQADAVREAVATLA